MSRGGAYRARTRATLVTVWRSFVMIGWIGTKLGRIDCDCGCVVACGTVSGDTSVMRGAMGSSLITFDG